MTHLIFPFRTFLTICVALALFAMLAAAPVGAASGAPGEVTVISSPGGAVVGIDGSGVGQTSDGSTPPLILSVSPGQHTLMISKQGYQVYVGTITVASGVPQTVAVTLSENPPAGYILIQSTPGSASATVDGGTVHITPANVSGLSPGTHTVQVTMPGFQPWTKAVTVQADRTTTVNAVLNPRPDTGTLSVTSSPPGADIYLDEQYWGYTPATIGNVVQGGHTLRLRLAGYQDWPGTVSIAGGKTTTLHAVMIPVSSPTGGDIVVTSSPSGAAIYLDGTYWGRTVSSDAVDVTGVVPGPHTVILTMEGYKAYETGVTVNPGQTVRVSATLVSQSGTTGAIVVASSPSGADVYLDNRYLGVTPLTQTGIDAGTHSVMLTMGGYTDWTSSVQVAAGQTAQVTASMTPAPIPQESGSVPATVIGALGAVIVVAGAAGGKKR
jgi:hypothetical protein